MDSSPLHLKNQLGHTLYHAADAFVRSYTPHLKSLDLTYAHYLIMLS